MEALSQLSYGPTNFPDPLKYKIRDSYRQTFSIGSIAWISVMAIFR